MADKDLELDPDAVDVLIQGISVLSNIATLASTWFLLRGQPPSPDDEAYRDNIRHQLRMLRRALEDAFEALESVLRILEESRRRRTSTGQRDLLNEEVRFGRAVMLTPMEFGHISNFLHTLDSSALQARSSARGLQMMAHPTGLPVLDNVTFDADAFNAQLNSILFESNTIGEAMTKLRIAQQQAEDFVGKLERALRRN